MNKKQKEIEKKIEDYDYSKVRYNKNLAGNKDCDEYIQKELEEAGVNVITDDYPANREVASTKWGKLGQFTFVRAWYYWCVYGDVPLDIAQEIYDHPIGRRYVRTSGYAGNIEPERQKSTRYNHDDPDLEWEKRRSFVIDSYHIDSQDGLNLFTETLRRYNLIKEIEANSQFSIDVSFYCPLVKNKKPTNLLTIRKRFNLSERDLENHSGATSYNIERIIERIYPEEFKECLDYNYSFSKTVIPTKKK